MPSPALKKIEHAAEEVRKTILKRQKPTLKFPLRSLSNVKYDPKKGHFEMRGRKKERTLTVSTVKTFAQTLRMMALSKELISQDDIATKREAYYVSKNWDDARFLEQPESDAAMDDISPPDSSRTVAASQRLMSAPLGGRMKPPDRSSSSPC